MNSKQSNAETIYFIEKGSRKYINRKQRISPLTSLTTCEPLTNLSVMDPLQLLATIIRKWEDIHIHASWTIGYPWAM